MVGSGHMLQLQLELADNGLLDNVFVIVAVESYPCLWCDLYPPLSGWDTSSKSTIS